MWWFFTLILTASYTANVSSFISNDRKNSDITSAKDLTERQIQYGTVYDASTYKFFKSSNDSIYKKIFTTMESAKPSVYTADNDEGRERVLKGKNKYAFFMESTSIEYNIQRYCELSMIGGRLDSKEYGIAMPKGSPLRSKINGAILKFQEDSIIDEIKKVWWEERDNTANCKEKAEETEDEVASSGSLQMSNTSGIFLVLLAGGVIGMVFAVTQFILHTHSIACLEKLPWKDVMRSEWKSSLNPRVLSKPVAPPRSASPSSQTRSSSAPRRSTSRAVSVLRAAQSFINLNDVY